MRDRDPPLQGGLHRVVRSRIGCRQRVSASLSDDCYGFDLDEEPGVYEGGDLDHRGRWIRCFEVPSPDLVDLIVEPHVPYEDGHLDYVVHPAAGLLDNGLHVLEHRLCLELYVSLSDHVPGGVHRDLTRNIDCPPGRRLHPRRERSSAHRREQRMCQLAVATEAYAPPTFGQGRELQRVARWRLRVGPYEVLLYSSGRGRSRRLAPYLSLLLQRIFIHWSNILC